MHENTSDRFLFADTTVLYPLGDGGSTSTQASSIFAAGTKGACVLTGLFITKNSAGGTITLYKHDGTTILYEIIVPANQVGMILIPHAAWLGTGSTLTNKGIAGKTSVATLVVCAHFFSAQG